MKKTILATLLLASLFTACKKEETTGNIPQADTLVSTTVTKDANASVKDKLAQLVNKTLDWTALPDNFTLLPVVEKDSVYIGFDLVEHAENLKVLKHTGYFSKEFIDNYDNIIKELDRKTKSNEFGIWQANDLPPFSFANDVNPWCNCQDDPGELNAPLKVGVISLDGDSGKFFYYYGNKEADANNYSYKFNAVKENGVWKISYMEGFDYKTSVRTDGEL
nr:hypothetical protein [uncultured Flavobacterium sp.]